MNIAAADLDLALEIVNLPWLRYDATHDDLQTIEALSGLASRDVHLTRPLVGMPEIADADLVTSLVWNDLYSLSIVASRDSDLVWEILATSPNPLSLRNRLLFRALSFFMSDRSGAFRELEQQPWFADGLNDEEAAFLAVTRDVLRNAPDEYYEMLTSRYAQSRTVNLPLAGEVSIWAIQKEPFPPVEDITASIAETIMAFEEFLGVPFSKDFVVALIPIVGPDTDIEVPYSSLSAGWNVRGASGGGHLRGMRTRNGSIPLSVLYHELAHY